MKLYNSIGPNPKVVRMFIAEKGLSIPVTQVDLMAGENRKPPYASGVNPAGQTPALELETGEAIAEITVICEYLEELHPTPALIGETHVQRAITRMWTRRIDLNVCEPMANGFRAAEGREMFAPRMKLVSKEAAADLKVIAKDRIQWLDAQMGDRTFVCGDRFTLADILLYAFLEFGVQVGQPLAGRAQGLQLPELVDEIYVQLCKHLTNNPRPESAVRGWQIVCMCVGTFPPSRDFENYLLNFILDHKDGAGAIGNYARYSLRRLEGILNSGPSGFVPSVDEIQAYKERPPILATIELVDGTPLTEVRRQRRLGQGAA